jgi:hypothetical protein
MGLGEVIAKRVGVEVGGALERILPLTLDRLEGRLAGGLSGVLEREGVWGGVTADFHSVTKAVFEEAFNELFMGAVFPRCQGAIQELLQQVNTTFVRGTKECEC